jgi:hypothetical protein
MFVFGVLALLLGLAGLIRPELLLSLLGFSVLDRAARAAGDYTIVFMTASSMASFNLGVYYILAALNDMKKFYFWTVPFRLVTFRSLQPSPNGCRPAFHWVGSGGVRRSRHWLSLYLDGKQIANL